MATPLWPFAGLPPLEIDVGSRLRALREERDWSLRELAEKSGLALNTVSLIENAKTSPSVSTLQRLALALSVPITAFFETDIPRNSVVHLTPGRRPRAAFAHGTLEDLGAGLAHRAVEPLVVALEPHTDSGPHTIVHTGYEFVYCLEGRLTYTIGDHAYVLEPGDSLLFESHLPHRWQNDGAQRSRAILVLFPTDVHDRPTERHFVPEGAQK
jgi:transcriptional regulator with XRE-family HTH domain